jgi:hypothetical protein
MFMFVKFVNLDQGYEGFFEGFCQEKSRNGHKTWKFSD